MQYILLKPQDNAEGQLDSNIGASTLTIVLESGDGALFPVIYRSTTTSGGTSTTLNKTGIGASGIAVGDFIENITDGSHAFVLAVSTDSLTTTELQGGGDNTWQNGDTYCSGRFIMTLNKRDENGFITDSEKVLIDNRVGDIFTVNVSGRGYDGSTAQTFDAGDYANVLVTSLHISNLDKGFAEMQQQLDLRYTKATIDAMIAARNWKDVVVVATTANGTLATGFENGDTIDGVTLTTGDRILIKDQSAPAENGIYTVNGSGAPTRAADFNSTVEAVSAVVAVKKGTSNADTVWLCTSDNPTIGTDPIVFAQVGVTLVKATTNEAQTGTDDTKFMTPSKVVDSLDARPYYRKSFTFGEAIDGTSTPKACYLKVSDGKVYMADANLSIEGEYTFIGFTKENISMNAVGNVIMGGVVTGFSGLTVNQNYYLSDTAGAISATPSTTANYRVCRAMTADSVLIEKGPRIFINSATISQPAISGNTDTTINLPFKPKRIYIKGHVTICDSAGGTCQTMVFQHEWDGTTSLGGSRMVGAGNGSISTVSGGSFSSSNPQAAPGSGSNRSSLTLSIQSVTDTSAVIRLANAITAGTGSNNGGGASIVYVIEG